MNTKIFLSFLIGGMVVALISPSDAAREWLATGTVTKTDGSTFFFMGKDSRLYTIDAASSQVLIKDFGTDYSTIRVGDKVRVYGRLSGSLAVKAARVRIFGREPGEDRTAFVRPEAKVVVAEMAQPVETGAGPEATVRAECRPQPCTWDAQGLITDFNYDGRQILLQTSSGNYRVNVGRALMTNNRTQIGLGRLNVGDAVVVQGTVIGQNEVNASRLNVARTRSESEGALPQHRVSIIGLIENIDYPSRTFRMSTAGPQVVVSADEGTTIWARFDALAFTELKPGIRVKVRGYGSLGAGYSATNIQVIGTAP